MTVGMNAVRFDHVSKAFGTLTVLDDITFEISTDDFRMLNGCLDSAIAGAVTQFGRERSQSGEQSVSIEADRQTLGAALMNLLQNASKFTAPSSTVTLRVGASPDRVLIDLGLAFSRWAVEANNGRIYARSLPGVGCVFTIDLPRLLTAAERSTPAGR